MQPTRFLLLSTEFPPGPGGIGQHAWLVARALVATGKIVEVQTEADYADAEEVKAFDTRYQSERLSIIRNTRSGWRTYLERIKRSRDLIKTNQPDVLVLTGRFSIWVGIILKFQGLKLPAWAFVHGSEVGNNRSFMTKLTLKALRKADRIIAVSEFTRSLLPEYLKERTEVLPNGIRAADLPISSSIHEYSNWTGYPKLLTVGSVSPRKGQHRVIRALPVLLKYYPSLHYHIVGLPTHRKAFEELAKQLGVSENITFHGKLTERNDLYRAYRSADVFIMLSENQPDGDVEGFGIAILEANYFGIPAIGAKGCGIEDAIKHGSNGYLVDGNDARAIVQAVQNCLNHKELLGIESKKWAEAHEWNQLIFNLLNSETKETTCYFPH